MRARSTLLTLAARQFGVVTRRQALDAGLSSAAIGRLVGARTLIPLYRGVFALAWHAALVRESRALAVQPGLRGSGAALGRGDAARTWGSGHPHRRCGIVVVPVTARRLRLDPGGIERDLRAALGSSPA